MAGIVGSSAVVAATAGPALVQPGVVAAGPSAAAVPSRPDVVAAVGFPPAAAGASAAVAGVLSAVVVASAGFVVFRPAAFDRFAIADCESAAVPEKDGLKFPVAASPFPAVVADAFLVHGQPVAGPADALPDNVLPDFPGMPAVQPFGIPGEIRSAGVVGTQAVVG